ncbi:MAG: maleylpyruvate isomerase N-terminal domain-containing protein [Dehalococcoidia bacterium]
MTPDEIIRLIEETDARLESIRERLGDGGERSLATGEWRVRDALSHLAARANPVARSIWRMESALAPGGAPAFDIHEENAGQLRDRSGQSIADLLTEIRDGHRAAIDELLALDEETLARRFPVAFPPHELSVLEFIDRAGPQHDNGHLDEVEAALA